MGRMINEWTSIIDGVSRSNDELKRFAEEYGYDVLSVEELEGLRGLNKKADERENDYKIGLKNFRHLSSNGNLSTNWDNALDKALIGVERAKAERDEYLRRLAVKVGVKLHTGGVDEDDIILLRKMGYADSIESEVVRKAHDIWYNANMSKYLEDSSYGVSGKGSR